MFAALGFADRPAVGSLVPPSSSDGEWVGLFGQHGSVDDVGESAFEDDVRLPCPAAAVYAPVEQLARGGWNRAWVKAIRCTRI
jgi:hypothetical protein